MNGAPNATDLGGRVLMLGDTRGVSGGQYAVGRTKVENGQIPGPVGSNQEEHNVEQVYLYVKKDC